MNNNCLTEGLVDQIGYGLRAFNDKRNSDKYDKAYIDPLYSGEEVNKILQDKQDKLVKDFKSRKDTYEAEVMKTSEKALRLKALLMQDPAGARLVQSGALSSSDLMHIAAADGNIEDLHLPIPSIGIIRRAWYKLRGTYDSKVTSMTKFYIAQKLGSLPLAYRELPIVRKLFGLDKNDKSQFPPLFDIKSMTSLSAWKDRNFDIITNDKGHLCLKIYVRADNTDAQEILNKYQSTVGSKVMKTKYEYISNINHNIADPNSPYYVKGMTNDMVGSNRRLRKK